MSRDLKIIHVGLGPIGIGIARMVLAKEGLKVVGACDPAAEKANKDLGDVLGLGKKLRIKVAGDPVKFIKSAKADVAVVSTTSSAKVVKATIEALISRGINVVTTCEEFAYPVPANAKVFRDLDVIARKKKVTVLGTGVNPGFAMDALPIVLTGICQDVQKIYVDRIQDASIRRLPFQKKIGATLTPAEFENLVKTKAVRHVGLTESISMLADALGFKVDRIVDEIKPKIATETVKSPFLTVEPGQVCGLIQDGIGYRGKEAVITLHMEAYLGAPETYDEVRIEGSPNLKVRAIGGYHGDIATASIVVNSLPKVIDAKPGLHTMRTLPIPSFFRGAVA